MSEGRLIFKDPDELIHFLQEMAHIIGNNTEEVEYDSVAEDEKGDGAVAEEDSSSKEITANIVTQKVICPNGSTKLLARVDIPEGNPAANQIASLIKELYGEDTEISFNSAPEGLSAYYDPARRVYHFGDEVYGERAIIWCPIPQGGYLDVIYDFNPNEQSQYITVPLDTAHLDRYAPEIALEKDYQAAFELAKTKDEPGTVAICFNGKFYIPCTGFYDQNSGTTEYLVNVFNVKSCESDNRNIWTMLLLQVGNITEVLPFKFAKGTEIDWQAAVEYLLKSANASPYEQPLVKLFDDAEDSMIKLEPSMPKTISSDTEQPSLAHTQPKKKPKSQKKSSGGSASIEKSQNSDKPGI